MVIIATKMVEKVGSVGIVTTRAVSAHAYAIITCLPRVYPLYIGEQNFSDQAPYFLKIHASNCSLLPPLYVQLDLMCENKVPGNEAT